ncbi:hypothetical protein D3C86_1615450 [compost metagenome]
MAGRIRTRHVPGADDEDGRSPAGGTNLHSLIWQPIYSVIQNILASRARHHTRLIRSRKTDCKRHLRALAALYDRRILLSGSVQLSVFRPKSYREKVYAYQNLAEGSDEKCY